jgi:hypothetical protein
LKPSGLFVLEFPDVGKCAKELLARVGDEFGELGAIRALYAFDMTQIDRREAYCPYAFGWSAAHMVRELSHVGFRTVDAGDPVFHERRLWRDSRVEARK